MKSSQAPSIKKALDCYRQKPGSIIALLQGIQNSFGYLPEEALREASRELDIPLSKLFSVASFYNSFSLRPRGKHTVSVCLGTACHVKSGSDLLSMLSRELGVKSAGQTSDDGLFTLEKVLCLGCCSMAPVIKINSDIYGSMTQKKTADLIKQHRKKRTAQ